MVFHWKPGLSEDQRNRGMAFIVCDLVEKIVCSLVIEFPCSIVRHVTNVEWDQADLTFVVVVFEFFIVVFLFYFFFLVFRDTVYL